MEAKFTCPSCGNVITLNVSSDKPEEFSYKCPKCDAFHEGVHVPKKVLELEKKDA